MHNYIEDSAIRKKLDNMEMRIMFSNSSKYGLAVGGIPSVVGGYVGQAPLLSVMGVLFLFGSAAAGILQKHYELEYTNTSNAEMIKQLKR